MNKSKVEAEAYIQFLVASQTAYSCTEAERVQPEGETAIAHDAYTRLLHRVEPDAETLWQESAAQVDKQAGVLILDDTTLDKPYARQMGLVTRHGSGKHQAVVQGINLITLLWHDGERFVPCDYRLYDKANDSLSKNDPFRHMVAVAHERGFVPECVLFDSWYSGLDNLKQVRDLGWRWLTRLKHNRTVTLQPQTGQQPLSAVPLDAAGTLLHLKGYGLIRVFKIVTPHGDIDYWATNDLDMSELSRLRLAENSWAMETFHRGLKQCCGVERAQVRAARAQRNPIALALRAFLRIESFCYQRGISWYHAKLEIIRAAVRAYLAAPRYLLPPTA